MIDTFTSTGRKLFRHPDLIGLWMEGRPIPYSLQVALTERCNLNCQFCSVRNREKHYEFDPTDLLDATDKFIKLGTKTVEITGGGEPLLYPYFDGYVEYLVNRGMKIGLITNGIEINSHPLPFNWIRISANVYDYLNRIEIPKNFKGTLGFSYVWTEGISTIGNLLRIKEIAIQNGVEYIRLVPDCLGDVEKQNEFLREIAEEIGYPVFLQEKSFGTPSNCYWGYLKPFLYPDGYIYPCSSMVLNPEAGKKFNEIYRLCHWSAIEEVWKGPVRSMMNTDKCRHCVFTHQNELLEYSINVQKHEDFI